jgi:acetate kinase
MGFTPMEGLVMSTRAGSIDPGLLLQVARMCDSDISRVSNMLNKQSGLLGLSGFTMDMKELLRVEKEESNRNAAFAHDAVEVFIYSVQKHVGQLLASLDFNLDAIVFTGGIGENSAEIRARVAANLARLGITIDDELNRKPSDGGLISTTESRVKVYAIRTDEERQIAREAMSVIDK